MHYLHKRRRKERKERKKKLMHKAVDIIINIALFAILEILFTWAALNWIMDCCKPGGECFPAKLYPQCVEIHKEVPNGH